LFGIGDLGFPGKPGGPVNLLFPGQVPGIVELMKTIDAGAAFTGIGYRFYFITGVGIKVHVFTPAIGLQEGDGASKRQNKRPKKERNYK
jgi:hypothetical protein